MTNILFCIFYILLFSAIIMRSKWFNAGGFSNKYLLGVFYLKLLFGVALWFIYTHIYKNRLTSDIFKYYDDARIIFNTLHTSVKDYVTLLTGIGDSGNYYQNIYHSMNNWENGYGTVLYTNSHFIIRMNAFFWLFSRGYYGVHVIFMCFISLVGLTYIYKAFLPFLQDRSKALFVAVFLFPSVILWSSGILKEGFVWFGLGLSIHYFFKLVTSGQRSVVSNQKETKILNPKSKILNRISYPKGIYSDIIYLIAGFAILFESKAYILLCIIPCFVALFLIEKVRYCKTHSLLTYLMVVVFYVASSLLPHIFLHKISPIKMLSDKQVDFNHLTCGGIYLVNIKDTLQYARIPLRDSLDILPLNATADSLLHKKGIQYLAGNSFWYKEYAACRYIPFMLKEGTPYCGFKTGYADSIHAIATDSTAYGICVYIEPARSSVYIEPIKPTFKSIFKSILESLKTSMILPYPWKIHSAMTAIYCAENILVLVLIFIALFYIKFSMAHKEIALFCLTYCLMMLVLIGMVTPILGGIERYKSVVIPFIFILLLLITEKPIAKG